MAAAKRRSLVIDIVNRRQAADNSCENQADNYSPQTYGVAFTLHGCRLLKRNC